MASQYSRESDPGSKTYQNSAFIPATIEMVNKSKHMSSNESSSIVYVLVCKVEDHNDNDYYLRDETGTLKGKIYKNVHKTTVHAIQEYTFAKNEYATAVGNFKNVGNEFCFILSRLTNVNSYKEVVFHRAQILWALLIKNNVLKVPEVKVEVQHMENDSLDKDVNSILNFVKAHSVKGEVGIDDIKRRNRINPVKIEKILHDLVENGYLIESNDFTLFKLA